MSLSWSRADVEQSRAGSEQEATVTKHEVLASVAQCPPYSTTTSELLLRLVVNQESENLNIEHQVLVNAEHQIIQNLRIMLCTCTHCKMDEHCTRRAQEMCSSLGHFDMRLCDFPLKSYDHLKKKNQYLLKLSFVTQS